MSTKYQIAEQGNERVERAGGVEGSMRRRGRERGFAAAAAAA